MANPILIKVKVSDTQSTLFEGEVDRITSFNEVGQFDVYPMHANFISIIRKNLTLYLKDKVLKDMKIEQAVMKVKKDEVHIFLGIETFVIDDETTQEKLTTGKNEKKH
jgi:F0F1-type ATP synthase epsilon subunit